MKVLVVAETRAGELRASSLEVVSVGAGVAAETGGSVSVAVIDTAPDALADELSVAGVDELVLITAPSAHFEPSSHRELVAAAVADVSAELVLTPMSVNSLGFVSALAATEGWGLATDVTSIKVEDGELRAVRSEYAGKVDVELAFPGKPVVVASVREGLFQRAAGPGSPKIRPLETRVEAGGVEHIEYTTPAQDPGIDITGAELLVAVGRGIEDEDDLQQFDDLAKAMGGTLAVSRPLVDAGWAPERSAGRPVGQDR